MRMKFISFMNSTFVDKYYTPKNSKLAKISSLKFMLKKSYLSQYFMHGLQQMRAQNLSKTVKSKNSSILLFNVIDFKLRLINFVYILLRHPVENYVLKTIGNDLNLALLSFRHLEMIWHTQENIRITQIRFMFFNLSFVCQTITTSLKLNSPRLRSLSIEAVILNKAGCFALNWRSSKAT